MFYTRTGSMGTAGAFETDAAVKAGDAVHAEVKHSAARGPQTRLYFPHVRLAHEIGPPLLPSTPPQPKGLMRGKWDQEDFGMPGAANCSSR